MMVDKTGRPVIACKTFIKIKFLDVTNAPDLTLTTANYDLAPPFIDPCSTVIKALFRLGRSESVLEKRTQQALNAHAMLENYDLSGDPETAIETLVD